MAHRQDATWIYIPPPPPLPPPCPPQPPLHLPTAIESVNCWYPELRNYNGYFPGVHNEARTARPAYDSPNSAPRKVKPTRLAAPDVIPSRTAAGTWKWHPDGPTRYTLPPELSRVPPLAVYHICRICLRPRSATYHRENPIPINGVPPPPGICRRCRVATIEEMTTVADVLKECESNDVKLGVKCLVPDEDIFTKQDIRALRNCSYPNIDKIHLQDAQQARPYDNHHLVRFANERPIGTRADRSADSEIRQIAREEIERYRQAERRLEKHPEPYAHGKLIPIDPKAAVGNGVEEHVAEYPYPVPLQNVSVHSSYDSEYSDRSTSPDNERNSNEGSKREPRWSPRIQSAEEFHVHDVSSSRGRAADSNTSRFETENLSSRPENDHPVDLKLREVAGIEKQLGSVAQTMTQNRSALLGFPSPRRKSKVVAVDSTHTTRGVNSVPLPSPAPDPPLATASIPPSPVIPVSRPTKHQRMDGPKCGEQPKEYSDRQERLRVRQKCTRASPSDGNHDWSLREREASRACGERASGQGKTYTSAQRGVGTNHDCPHQSDQDTHPWEYDPRHSSDECSDEVVACHDTSRHKRCNAEQSFNSEAALRRKLPYPDEKSPESIPMPSPSVSPRQPRPAESAGIRELQSKLGPGEYLYVERITRLANQPRSSPPHELAFHDQRQEERTAQSKSKKPSQGQGRPRRSWQRQDPQIDRDLSHVRFSSKVDVSPTPPGSDASSVQFRTFSKAKRCFERYRPPGHGVYSASSPGIRGRSRERQHNQSRHSTGRYREQCHVTDHQEAGYHSSTSQHNYPGSPPTLTAFRPDQTRPLVHALSESPSRENLRELARERESNGAGPYCVPKEPSLSEVAQDGSRIGAEEVRRQHEQQVRFSYRH